MRCPRRAQALGAGAGSRAIFPRSCGLGLRAAACAIAALLLLWACSTVPYTQRSQLVLLPESQELALGAAAFEEVLQKEKAVSDPRLVDPVREVGLRIAAVAERPDYEWEFAVLRKDDTVNAFALPGGKVAVYTGLFPVAATRSGLAAVLGHEVAHVLARHGAERMSQGLLLEIGAAGIAAALGGASPTTRQAILQAYGLGAQIGYLLPFSRSQESEADHIGLILMAKAGYDPRAALGLWDRMEEAAQREERGAPPEFLSTHPSYDTRRQNIQGWLDEALAYFDPATAAVDGPLPRIEPDQADAAGKGAE